MRYFILFLIGLYLLSGCSASNETRNAVVDRICMIHVDTTGDRFVGPQSSDGFCHTKDMRKLTGD